jgi:hypothetical protein
MVEFVRQHAAHLVAGVLAPALFLGWVAFATGWRARGRVGWRVGAAAASLLAAMVHLAVCPEHFAEGALYGWFFLALGLGQAAFSWLLMRRPGQAVIVAGLLANAGTLALWMWTRTAGVPLGPHRHVEAVGAADLTATVAELAVVVLCVRATGRFGWNPGESDSRRSTNGCSPHPLSGGGRTPG